MPELPEIHTIVNDLKEKIIGYKINKDTITDVSRLAKNILIHLESGRVFRIHLAMTGRILIREADAPTDKWAVQTLYLNKGNKRKKLVYADMRKFGKLELLDKTGLNNIKLKYGPDIYLENITPKEFLNIIKSKNTIIKTLLLDQKKISGLGNIYATEALFLAGIHPQTKTKNFNIEMATKLLNGAKKVIKEGIKYRGSTLPDKMYVDTEGNPGNYQKHFKVYMRKKCYKCQTSIENIKIGGRSSFFCPTCQKLPTINPPLIS